MIFLILLDHINYLGEDEKFGVIAISYRRTKADVKSVFSNVDEDGPLSQYEYHIIVRTSEVRLIFINQLNYNRL